MPSPEEKKSMINSFDQNQSDSYVVADKDVTIEIEEDPTFYFR
jgi:hypothetical protein